MPTKEEFVAEIDNASSYDDKLAVAIKHKGQHWDLGIPQITVGDLGLNLNVGDLESGSWTYTPQGGALRGVKLASGNAEMGSPIRVKVRPVVDKAESQKFGGAFLILETM
jgi:hypothetical protein